MTEQVEKLASGKKIIRHLDEAGETVTEMHTYGMLEFGLSRRFDGTRLVEEMYFSKRKLISRKRYEKLRVDYPDMPAADAAIEDLGSELLKGVAQERRARKQAAAARVADPAQAAQHDQFCQDMLQRGVRAEAVEWLTNKSTFLGERTHIQSRNLVNRLMKLGCRNVHACEIQIEDDGDQYTGHLVIELPGDPESRGRVFTHLGKLAGEQGFAADFDDGQRFAYLNLG